ncbi:MAG: 4Fe-4S dicluster domain-containing protein, partial [Planctomycetes bacterium]|nr:4Fe-4S dicluster domain-containing protein [Planctomycetota bacterium]MCU0727728.1 4Fe-4S dicluster domain-containing protein [Planctomycetota bacterium]
PELRAGDDRLRAMPELCAPGGRFFRSDLARETAAWFDGIARIRPDPGLAARRGASLRAAADLTDALRRILRGSGAVAAGFATVDPAFVYSHKGRFDADYGRPIPLDFPRAAVFLVPMDYAAMRRAPRAEALRESARQYYRAAGIAFAAEAALRAAGFAAKAWYDAHYDAMLVPLAVQAGLGELGRNNILVADRFGARVRIGAVATDAPLRPDRPVSLGVAGFCEICRRCAEACPSRALATGPREVVRGVLKWPTHVERCHAYWRRAGTDCGLCMAVCPFSHRDNALHAAVRCLLRRFPAFRRPALWGERLLFARLRDGS